MKINKESIQKVSDLENQYKINNCEFKGHLQALKVKCMELEHNINLNKQVNLLQTKINF